MNMFLLFSLPLFGDSDAWSDENRLSGSTSPYLLQHADNPVHWLPWGTEAFEEARRLDKPILVSIGYSTCHWCHVMEHENFEDPATAALMNKNFINIKVDREELPGVDAFYMEAAALMGGSTGWPLHVFIDGEGKPFYAGTYFPRDLWQNLLNRIGSLWQTHREELQKSGSDLTAAVERNTRRVRGVENTQPLTSRELEQTGALFIENLKSRFDEEFPGFPATQGSQFPPSLTLALLLELESPLGRIMTERILQTMQDSGLHDRVGGGFHRYTVDRGWRVPHFEKMLYDNVQLMGLYARASVLFRREDFLQTAVDTADYLLRDMLIPEKDFGGFGLATAEDADDPGGEGAFYAWSPRELKSFLSLKDAELLTSLWDLKEEESLSRDKKREEPVTGWIPYPLGSSIRSPDTDLIRSLKENLLSERNKRPRPGRDGKVLTDLNALALEGFALLAGASGEPRFFKAVEQLSGFLIRRYRESGLIRTPGIDPYITDYAYMILGLTAAYPVLEDPSLIQTAMEIAALAEKELGTGTGSYYSAPERSTELPVRRIDSYDSQTPSGQNALALGFARLYGITGREEYRNKVDNITGSQKEQLLNYPDAFSVLIRANLLLSRNWHIVLAGDPEISGYSELKKELLRRVGSDYLILTTPGVGNETWPLITGRKELTRPQVLICNDRACLLPVFTVGELETRFKEAGIY